MIYCFILFYDILFYEKDLDDSDRELDASKKLKKKSKFQKVIEAKKPVFNPGKLVLLKIFACIVRLDLIIKLLVFYYFSDVQTLLL